MSERDSLPMRARQLADNWLEADAVVATRLLRDLADEIERLKGRNKLLEQGIKET